MKNNIWLWIGSVWVIVILALTALFSFSTMSTSSDPNLQRQPYGSMSKLKYSGHTYVVWVYGYKGGMVHDPDCECGNRRK